MRALIPWSMWQKLITTPLKFQFNIETMNFNHESQIKPHQILLDIFGKHHNAVFSIEWTATKAPYYSFVGVKTATCQVFGHILFVECESQWFENLKYNAKHVEIMFCKVLQVMGNLFEHIKNNALLKLAIFLTT